MSKHNYLADKDRDDTEGTYDNDPIYKFGFGRNDIEDERDQNYPLADALREQDRPYSNDRELDEHYQYWYAQGWKGDQGRTPHCVAYCAAHYLEDGPDTHFYENRDQDPVWMEEGEDESLIDTVKLYNEAQKRDAWEGEDYRGTSVRAGMKVLRDCGLIEEYRWAQSMDQVLDTLLTRGPICVGTKWYRDMYYPDEDGHIEVGGEYVGGHAYLLNGINLDRGVIRMKNSWGSGWGSSGMAYLSIDDVQSLLFERGGRACVPIERLLDDYDKKAQSDKYINYQPNDN